MFIVISSVMVWAGTDITEAERLSDADYERRKPIPGSKYEGWKEMEDLAIRCFTFTDGEGRTSPVRPFVIGSGLLYGEGESTFGEIFKSAWAHENYSQNMYARQSLWVPRVMTPGGNHIPMVHSRDVARLVKQLAFLPPAELFVGGDTKQVAKPYLLAVDKADSTQQEIVSGIMGELSDTCEIHKVDQDMDDAQVREKVGLSWGEAEEDVEAAALAAALASDLKEAMSIDLQMEASSPMLAEDFGSQSEPAGWWSQEGLLSNVKKVAAEFCHERLLQPVRILVVGPPLCGKTTLAKALSAHFNIPLMEMPLLHEGPKAYTDASAQLSDKNVSRYRGHVIDGCFETFQDCDQVFRYDFELPPDEEDAAPPVAEGEDPIPVPPKIERRLREDITPQFVVIMHASQDFLRSRVRKVGEDGGAFQARAERYFRSAEVGPEQTLSDFFQDVVGIEVFNLPAGGGAGKDPEDLFESARIFIENAERPDLTRGRPFNYLDSGNAVAQAILKMREQEMLNELARLAEVEKKKYDGVEEQRQEELRREAIRAQIILAHEKERAKIEQLPLREYLMRYMVPSLTEGLIEICRVLPEDPVDYLAEYLETAAKEVSKSG